MLNDEPMFLVGIWSKPPWTTLPLARSQGQFETVDDTVILRCHDSLHTPPQIAGEICLNSVNYSNTSDDCSIHCIGAAELHHKDALLLQV